VEQAKKPLPKEDQQKSQQAKSSAPQSLHDVAIPKDEPTSHAKSQAAEKQTLTELATGKAKEDEMKGKEVAKKEEEKKKLTLWQKVKKEAVHYWDGTKLLATEVRISSRLALKMAAGYELTRRENRQVAYPKSILSLHIDPLVASTYCPGSWSSSPFLRLRHCSFRRIAASGCLEAFPQLAS